MTKFWSDSSSANHDGCVRIGEPFQDVFPL